MLHISDFFIVTLFKFPSLLQKHLWSVLCVAHYIVSVLVSRIRPKMFACYKYGFIIIIAKPRSMRLFLCNILFGTWACVHLLCHVFALLFIFLFWEQAVGKLPPLPCRPTITQLPGFHIFPMALNQQPVSQPTNLPATAVNKWAITCNSKWNVYEFYEQRMLYRKVWPQTTTTTTKTANGIA